MTKKAETKKTTAVEKTVDVEIREEAEFNIESAARTEAMEKVAAEIRAALKELLNVVKENSVFVRNLKDTNGLFTAPIIMAALNLVKTLVGNEKNLYQNKEAVQTVLVTVMPVFADFFKEMKLDNIDNLINIVGGAANDINALNAAHENDDASLTGVDAINVLIDHAKRVDDGSYPSTYKSLNIQPSMPI